MLGSKSLEFRINGKIWLSEPTKGNEQNKQGDFSSYIINFFDEFNYFFVYYNNNSKK